MDTQCADVSLSITEPSTTSVATLRGSSRARSEAMGRVAQEEVTKSRRTHDACERRSRDRRLQRCAKPQRSRRALHAARTITICGESRRSTYRHLIRECLRLTVWQRSRSFRALGYPTDRGHYQGLPDLG